MSIVELAAYAAVHSSVHLGNVASFASSSCLGEPSLIPKLLLLCAYDTMIMLCFFY